MRPTALLFDWDNTLVDGWAAIQAGLNAAFRAFALPEWDRAMVLANTRHSLKDAFPTMFGADWPRARDIFYAEVQSCHLTVLRPMPGAEALLDSLGALPLAVISNKQGPLLRREAAHLGWDARFVTLVGAGDAAADKPDAAPLHLALARMGRTAGRDIWYVGDTALDMAAARAAGCTAVLLGDAEHDGGVAHCAPDLHFTHPHDLAAHAKALDIQNVTSDIQG